MSRVFRRRKKDVPDDVEELEDVDGGLEDEAVPDEPEVPAVPARPQGPWDVDDVPADDAVQRLDLGGLRVPVPPGLEVRVDVNPEGEVVDELLRVDGPGGRLVLAALAPAEHAYVPPAPWSPGVEPPVEPCPCSPRDEAGSSPVSRHATC